jgi:hypothetical protein
MIENGSSGGWRGRAARRRCGSRERAGRVAARNHRLECTWIQIKIQNSSPARSGDSLGPTFFYRAGLSPGPCMASGLGDCRNPNEIYGTAHGKRSSELLDRPIGYFSYRSIYLQFGLQSSRQNIPCGVTRALPEIRRHQSSNPSAMRRVLPPLHTASSIQRGQYMRDAASDEAHRYRTVIVAVLALLPVTLHPYVTRWHLNVFVWKRSASAHNVSCQAYYPLYRDLFGVVWVSTRAGC